MSKIDSYILAKDEEKNISDCINALKRSSNINRIIIYDSGSTDHTKEIASSLNTTIVDYKYINHCVAYNQITENDKESGYVIILDADMIVSSNLINEIHSAFTNGFEVIISPVEMFYAGQKLKYSSLCPPKAIAFKTGNKYFEPVGHGEKLITDVKIKRTLNSVKHIDKKPFDRFISSQLLYAKNFIERQSDGKMNYRDRIRQKTPLGIILTPFIAYFLKLGFLDGKSGLIYALDRLIAEAIIYRYSVSEKEHKQINKKD